MATPVTTRDILETFTSIRNELRRRHTVTLEFRAYTPVWTGSYNEGRTRASAGEHTIEYGPTSMSIIGVARWLLRSIGPCRPENGMVFHRTCEEAASRAFGSLGNASPIVVRMEQSGARPLVEREEIEVLEEAVDLAGTVSLAEVKTACNRPVREGDQEESISETVIYTALSKAVRHFLAHGTLDNLCSNPELGLSYQEKFVLGCCAKRSDNSRKIGEGFRRVLLADQNRIRTLPALLAVPRFLINTMGKSPLDIYSYAPLAPGHQLTTEIHPRNHVNPDWHALALAAGSIAVALAVLGVGKATTRGFGRYRLVEYELPNDMPTQIKGKLENVLEQVRGIYEANNPRDSASRISNSFSQIHSESLEI